LSRREARWSEILGNFGVFPITLNPGKIHVIGELLSRAPHVIHSLDQTSAVLNSTEVPYFDGSEILKHYEDDQFFELWSELYAMNGRIMDRVKGNWKECSCYLSRTRMDANFIRDKCVFREDSLRAFFKLLMTQKLVVISDWQRRCPDSPELSSILMALSRKLFRLMFKNIILICH
jgi:hypothetical protein